MKYLIVGLILLLLVVVLVWCLIIYLRNKVRKVNYNLFGTTNFAQGLQQIQDITEEIPKSLNGCDSIYVPQIMQDFPDFNVTRAKQYAQKYLQEQLAVEGFQNILIHNTVICYYQRYGEEKNIHFQSAVEYFLKNGKKCQERYEMIYAFMPIIHNDATTQAAVCSNCGAPFPADGSKVCAFCGSRLSMVLNNSWQFISWEKC